MKRLFVFSVLIIILSKCNDRKETISPTCAPKPINVSCNEDSNQRSIDFDCLQPDNDSIYWTVIEVQVKYTLDYPKYPDLLFDSSAQLVEYLLTYGQTLYSRNTSCPESCEPENCEGDYYDVPETDLRSLWDGFFFTYTHPDGRLSKVNCSLAPENTFRFIIVSDLTNTRVIGGEELQDFLGGIDSFSEAIVQARMENVFTNDPIEDGFGNLDMLGNNEGQYTFKYFYTDYKFLDGDTCQINNIYRTHRLDTESGKFFEPEDSLISQELGFEASAACIPCAPFN